MIPDSRLCNFEPLNQSYRNCRNQNLRGTTSQLSGWNNIPNSHEITTCKLSWPLRGFKHVLTCFIKHTVWKSPAAGSGITSLSTDHEVTDSIPGLHMGFFCMGGLFKLFVYFVFVLSCTLSTLLTTYQEIFTNCVRVLMGFAVAYSWSKWGQIKLLGNAVIPWWNWPSCICSWKSVAAAIQQRKFSLLHKINTI